MEEVVEKVKQLRLDILDLSWVESILCSEYLEFEELPKEYDSTLKKIKILQVFENIINAVDSWLSTETVPDEEKSWATLSHEIATEKLLALLAYLNNRGTKNVMKEQLRTEALLAARVYFKLLMIPGFIVYNIYHSQLFANSLACIGFPKIFYDQYDEMTKSKDSKDKTKKIGIREARQQINAIVKELQLFVVDLKAIINGLPVSPDDMSFEDILNNLIDITGGAIIDKLGVVENVEMVNDLIELARVTVFIYEVIHTLVRQSNGLPNPVVVRYIFKCLHNKLVAVCLHARASNEVVKSSLVSYIGVVLNKFKKVALDSFIVFLEHLCYTLDGLERAEVRTARVKIVSGLMTLLPKQMHSRFLKWIIVLSKTSKAVHRHLAVDLLEQMLNYNDGVAPEENGENHNLSRERQGDITEALNVNGPENNQQVTSEEGVSQNGTATPNDPEPDVTEEDLQSMLQARTITVPYDEILRALYERVHDASGSVRTRAVAVLTKCLDNANPDMQRALQEMQGEGEVSRLMAVAARCVCDERATVRRSGALLLLRLLETQTATPGTIDLGILVRLCRDASIIVRSAAINGLADLVLKRPSTGVFDAFLSGPVHQLSDPEAKVQDTVRALTQNLLIDRIKKYSVCDEDPLPWMLLASITKHNMRRHLQKACAQLAQNANCISVFFVDCLSTHLGALGNARDLQTLVMLTSVARHVDYPDISFVLQYYYQLFERPQNEDNEPRLMPLTIELISMWSRYATPEEKLTLRDHLVRRLAAPTDDDCRIMCGFLAAQLDPWNLTWATELMQLAERAAIDGGDVAEWVRAADLSLVAPAAASDELLQLFLQGMRNPPPNWSAARAGECVAGAGRLCVRSRAAAAAVAPAAAALLHADRPLQARVNAVLVLSDICTRYSNIVEPLLGSVCRCLDQSSPQELRRNAVRAVTRLLLSGYLRLRAPLYYRYCALLADEDHDVREPAEYYVTCCLTIDSIYFHFVDCIQYYNCDTTENITFDARQLIYDVMLQRLSLVQRLNVQCRLAREILENAADIVDEGEEIPQSMNNAILDTITVLCGPRMRLPTKKQTSANGDINDIDDLQERVTTNLVSQQMKHTVAEVVIPAVLRLHARLRARGGQLLAYLVRLATDLLNDYRQEIEDIIETDEELVEQIQQFQETIGLEPSKGNTRNLVTSSAPPEPETPRAPRRRAAARPDVSSLRKRALRI